jgi:hypothetical protein
MGKRQPIHYGWVIVAITIAGMMLVYGTGPDIHLPFSSRPSWMNSAGIGVPLPSCCL